MDGESTFNYSRTSELWTDRERRFVLYLLRMRNLPRVDL